ncbi:CgeB family protein [Pirellulaceae bacterium SH501]
MLRTFFIGHHSRSERNTSSQRFEALSEASKVLGSISFPEVFFGSSLLERVIHSRLSIGPVVNRFNSEIRNRVREVQPEFVWIDKGVWVSPETIAEIRRVGAKRIVHYTPDTAFVRYNTSHFRRSISLYDAVITTKHYDLDNYLKFGAKQTVYLPPSYDSMFHRWNEDDRNKEILHDASFIGAYYPGREKLLEKLVKAGVDLAILGPRWNRCRSKILYPHIRRLAPSGREYHKALRSARVGLGFLSHLVPDQTTTRTVEIPAAMVCLVANSTPEAKRLFEDGKDAVLFKDSEELVGRVRDLLKNGSMTDRIASNGYHAVMKMQCDVKSQVDMVLEKLA